MGEAVQWIKKETKKRFLLFIGYKKQIYVTFEN